MKTIILPARYTPDSVLLETAAKKIGWSIERFCSWDRLEKLRGQDVTIYQELSMGHVFAEALGVDIAIPKDGWLPSLPQKYLQRKVLLTTPKQTKKLSFPLFVKDVAEKRMDAGIYSTWKRLMKDEKVTSDMDVLVSEVVSWGYEYRFFIRERQVLTFSPYFFQGNLAINADGEWQAPSETTRQALSFIQSLLADNSIELPKAVVIDVGEIFQRGWAVVEANPAWGCGLYGCCPNKVLQVLEVIC